MNARTSARMLRIKKEVRALFWPWCAVVIAGLSPLVLPHSYAESISFLSFFIGVPLLATLSLGNEFQHGTLSLWLTQPFSRMQLWGEKVSVMVPAVLSAGLVSGIVMFSVTWPHMRLTYKAAALAYVLVAIASATFWTLAARSTIAALLLISFLLFFGSLFSGGIGDEPRAGHGLTASLSPAATIIVISTFGFCFAALMLWLSARKLARFQATGGSTDSDLLMTGPTLMPEAVAAWFRCRPIGSFLNLLRKESRLLRPLWLIALPVVLYVACLAIFRLLPAPPVPEPRTVLEWALLGPLVSLCIAMAGLAGILSLGEERTSGTLAWHMTLPISTRRQWLIKLVVAMLAGTASAVLFPVLAMLAGGTLFGSPLMYVDPHSLADDLLLFAILTFICFWCACAANGTVRAAIWAVPATAVIALACSGGIWLGEELTRTTGTLRDFVVSSFHLNPFAFATLIDFAREHVLWLFVPTLLLALLQSYWLFRAPSQGGTLWMLRCILPLAALTILWSFSASAGFLFSRWEPFQETRHALDKFQPTTANLQLTGERLAKESSLSPFTQRWLTGSHITVAPELIRSSGYRATIHLASGLECTLTVVHFSSSAAASCVQKAAP